MLVNMRWLAPLFLSLAALEDVGASGSFLTRSRSSDLHLVVEDPKSKCAAVLLTTFFTSRKDPQRGIRRTPTFDYFSKYYESILAVPGGGVRSIVFHDGLPKNLTEKYAVDGKFAFEQVDLAQYDPDMMEGLNDVRFQVYLDKVKAHPEWETVFMTDVSDVTLVHNPCALVAQAPTKLFVGNEELGLHWSPYMENAFTQMGGKYIGWLQEEMMVDSQRKIMNAGVIGGRHDVAVSFLEKMVRVLEDPNLKARKFHKDHLDQIKNVISIVGSPPAQGTVTANMPALNWILANEYSASDIVSGEPVNSKFKGHQTDRKDVYFVHKF